MYHIYNIHITCIHTYIQACIYLYLYMLVAGSQAICQRLEKYTIGYCHEEEIRHPRMEVTDRKGITVLGRVL